MPYLRRFLCQGHIDEVENKLIGTRLLAEDLQAVLADLDMAHYFGKVSAEELVGLILSEG